MPTLELTPAAATEVGWDALEIYEQAIRIGDDAQARIALEMIESARLVALASFDNSFDN